MWQGISNFLVSELFSRFLMVTKILTLPSASSMVLVWKFFLETHPRAWSSKFFKVSMSLLFFILNVFLLALARAFSVIWHSTLTKRDFASKHSPQFDFCPHFCTSIFKIYYFDKSGTLFACTIYKYLHTYMGKCKYMYMYNMFIGIFTKKKCDCRRT